MEKTPGFSPPSLTVSEPGRPSHQGELELALHTATPVSGEAPLSKDRAAVAAPRMLSVSSDNLSRWGCMHARVWAAEFLWSALAGSQCAMKD